jgi:DNA-binding XRE family transcriptional regulator
MTQTVFADRVGISRAHLQAIESGRSSPTVEVAYKIKATIRCEWTDLFG